MISPKVSILTTVYNREKYIAECIESVLNSTFLEWEMIIVDDKSSDKSVQIASSYAKLDQRISIYVNEENLGDYPNRNRAASYAKGKYLKYLDADDLIYPHGLEIMVDTMEKFENAALGISQQVAEDYLPYPFQMSPEESFRREFLKRGVMNLGPTGTIIRRSVFEELGGFTGTRYIGDLELWYKLALNFPVVKMVPGLIFWRQHDEQEIKKGQDSYFYLENTFNHSRSVINDDRFPLSESEKEIALGMIEKRFSRDIMKLYLKGEFTTANKILASCNWSLMDVIANI